MSKAVTTRWYIGAWVVAAISAIVFFMTAHTQTSSTGASAVGTSPISVVAWLVVGIFGIVMHARAAADRAGDHPDGRLRGGRARGRPDLHPTVADLTT